MVEKNSHGPSIQNKLFFETRLEFGRFWVEEPSRSDFCFHPKFATSIETRAVHAIGRVVTHGTQPFYSRNVTQRNTRSAEYGVAVGKH